MAGILTRVCVFLASELGMAGLVEGQGHLVRWWCWQQRLSALLITTLVVVAPLTIVDA